MAHPTNVEGAEGTDSLEEIEAGLRALRVSSLNPRSVPQCAFFII
jgi:hypothetical protein